jgi:hypothetical protein
MIALPLGPGGSLIPVAGISATPYEVDSSGVEGTQAPAYAARVGSTAAPSLVSNTSGNVSYWLEEGDYNIHYQDTQIAPRVAPWTEGYFSSASGATSRYMSMLYGLQSDLPEAGYFPRNWYSTDKNRLFLDVNTGWDEYVFKSNIRSLSADDVAKSNDEIWVPGGQTITLPPGFSGAWVTVHTGSATSGTNQTKINVDPTTTDRILLEGWAAQPQALLGIPYGHMTLIYDGVHWLVRAGQNDTGWVPLSGFAAGVGIPWAPTPGCRVRGNMGMLRGTLSQVSGSTPSNTQLARAFVGPHDDKPFSSVAYNLSPVVGSVIHSSGSITVSPIFDSGAGAMLGLDDVFFFIDL